MANEFMGDVGLAARDFRKLRNNIRDLWLRIGVVAMISGKQGNSARGKVIANRFWCGRTLRLFSF